MLKTNNFSKKLNLILLTLKAKVNLNKSFKTEKMILRVLIYLKNKDNLSLS